MASAGKPQILTVAGEGREASALVFYKKNNRQTCESLTEAKRKHISIKNVKGKIITAKRKVLKLEIRIAMYLR